MFIVWSIVNILLEHVVGSLGMENGYDTEEGGYDCSVVAKDLRLDSSAPSSPVNQLLSQSPVAMDIGTSNDSPLLTPRGFSRSGFSLTDRRKSFPESSQPAF